MAYQVSYKVSTENGAVLAFFLRVSKKMAPRPCIFLNYFQGGWHRPAIFLNNFQGRLAAARPIFLILYSVLCSGRDSMCYCTEARFLETPIQLWDIEN